MSNEIQQRFSQLAEAISSNVQLATSLAESNLRSFLDGPQHGCPGETCGTRGSTAQTPGLKAACQEPYKGATPFEVIYRFDRLRVFKFRLCVPAQPVSPLLLIPSLINRSYVMDLMKGGSLTEHLVGQGIPTYLLDWGTPGPQHNDVSFGTYIDDLIALAVEAVRRDAETDTVGMLGYCMGGTMAVIHAALHPDRIDRLTLLATPINFHDDSVLSAWAANEHFDPDRVIATLGRMDSLMLQSSFLWLKPLSQYQKYRGLYENANKPGFVDSFIKLETWLSDNVSVPGRAFREYVGLCYKDNALVNGPFELDGQTVDLKELTTPILNVMASKDHIVPTPSSQILSELVSGPVRDVLIDAGHIGIAMGRKARDMFGAVAEFHGAGTPIARAATASGG